MKKFDDLINYSTETFFLYKRCCLRYVIIKIRIELIGETSDQFTHGICSKLPQFKVERSEPHLGNLLLIIH